jgi:hypothetical protein
MNVSLVCMSIEHLRNNEKINDKREWQSSLSLS